MNIKLELSIDMVNTAVMALSQLQGTAQNALAAITAQAQAQVAPPAQADTDTEKPGGTD